MSLDYLGNKHLQKLKDKGSRFKVTNTNGYEYIYKFFDHNPTSFPDNSTELINLKYNYKDEYDELNATIASISSNTYVSYFDFLNNDITKIKNYRNKYKDGEYCPDSLPNESTFSLQDSNGSINTESQKILDFSHKVICGALEVHNDERWSLVADKINHTANSSGHNCGPGNHHSSLDSDQV